jgi:glyoxylase-like metal-dependent hydrolase (beta-lactamase superfamily II)
MTQPTPTHEVYALKFASWYNRTASHWFYRYDQYGEQDHPRPMDFFFWLIRNGDRTVLLDCGYDKERALRRHRQQDHEPRELLARFDVSPEDVDHVILSHLHFDHVGNLEMFPNATFTVARREFEFWSGPAGSVPSIQYPSNPEEIQILGRYASDGRVNLVEDSAELFPGIGVTRVGGHTPGQLVTTVESLNGSLVLASDAIHYYEEMEKDRIFAGYTDIEEMLATYRHLRDLDARPDTQVVAGHDPLVGRRFESVDSECIDLTRPVD